MFDRLKCKLGFHDWVYSEELSSHEPIKRYCRRCERLERQLPSEWMGLTDFWTPDN